MTHETTARVGRVQRPEPEPCLELHGYLTINSNGNWSPSILYLSVETREDRMSEAIASGRTVRPFTIPAELPTEREGGREG